MAKLRKGVSRFFSDNADAWSGYYYKRDFDSVSYQDRMHEAFHWLRRHGRGRMRILDVGCGAGVQADCLQQSGHDVFACDISAEMARKTAARIGPRALVCVGEQLPYASASFDVVISLGVIGYSSDPQRFLDSLQRVLKPGGLLIISMANDKLLLSKASDAVSRLPVKLYRWAKARLRGPLSAPAANGGFYRNHYNYMDARAFDGLLGEAGFQRLGGSGVNFGRLHFMGKHVTSEGAAIALSRMLSRASRRLSNLDRYSRIYVAAVRKPSSVDTSAAPAADLRRATAAKEAVQG